MPRKLGYLVILLLFNTAVAVILTMLGHNRAFALELLFSHCIGLSCGLPALVVISHARNTRQLRTGLLVSIFGGVIVGVALARMWSADVPAANNIGVGEALILGAVVALGVGYLFFSREGTRRLERELRAQQARHTEIDRVHAAMQLRLLQSQVEPHFLFNTLAHLSALIRSDPAQAETLLSHLNGFLRAALRRNRQECATLGDELTLVRDYLHIVGLRLGSRLRWRVEVEPGLETLAFPFMLVQPLVENAIKHGIEPKRSGGEVVLRVVREGDRVGLSVRDTGVGLRDPQLPTGSGIGLENVRQRLQALYGESAQLVIQGNDAGGVSVELDLPA